MSDLEEQKRMWGRDGHGIPGANPNFAGRMGIIGAAVVLIALITSFVFLTGGNTPTKVATQYLADTAKDDSLQLQLDQSLYISPASSSTIVHKLVRTLRTEDRRLSSEHWPKSVEGNVKTLVTINQQQISDLNKYVSASKSERVILLTQQNNDASNAADCGSLIRVTLGP